MYNNYEFDNRGNLRKKIVTISIISLVIIISLIVLLNLRTYHNSYPYYENLMVKTAKEYIKNNNISVNQEMYLDLSTLKMKEKDNCSLISGVLIDTNNNYEPYLSCQEYETDLIKNGSDYISLLGKEVVLLAKGINYTDPGYTGIYQVLVNGNVGTEAGVYNMRYNVISNNNIVDSLIRKVIVVDNAYARNLYPTITLKGNEIEYVLKGSTYVDKGVFANDVVDGSLNDVVKIDGFVNTYQIGEYDVSYSITNSRGYTNTIKRKVVVLNDFSTMLISDYISTTTLTNKDVEVTLSIVGNDYSYTILPNGTKNYSKDIKYIISENGTYEFYSFDKEGKSVTKTIEVTNIDKSVPTGTCEAHLYYDRTEVYVNLTTNKQISGYNYNINGATTGYINNSSYTATITNPASVRVNIKDIVGNEASISCRLEQKNTNDPNGITETISGKPKLEKPLAEALAKRGYTVNDLNMCIYNKVKKAGPGTRYGVVAAAHGLLDCMLDMTGSVLSYDHTGGKIHTDPDGTNYCSFNSDICGKIGVNTRWGRTGGMCKTDVCYYGLNCATFVRWSMCNGGMDLCSKGTAGASSMVNVNFFKEADGVIINGNSVKYYSGKDLTNYSAYDLVRMIQPGDVAFRERKNDTDGSSQHAFVIVGKDETGIYTANNGNYINRIRYASMLNGEYYYRLLFLDNYYANENNKNNLYN